METNYYGTVTLIEQVGEGLVGIRFDGDLALWSLVKTRKHKRCVITGEEIPKGSLAYRPVGNQMYRMQRISSMGMSMLRQDKLRGL